MPWSDLQEGILADIAGWQAPQEQLAFEFYADRLSRKRAQDAARRREWVQRVKVSDPAKYERLLAYSREWKRKRAPVVPVWRSHIERLAEARRQRRNNA